MNQKDHREILLASLPKAICSYCGKAIEDEKEVCPVKYLRGQNAIYRMYHDACHNTLVINSMWQKGWAK